MNRRSFLGWCGSIVTASVLGIEYRRKVPDIDYSLFCDSFSHFYDIENPFARMGTLYATNARILIAHPTVETGSDANLRLPPVDTLWWDELDKPGWKPLPRDCIYNARRKGGDICEVCYGRGRVGSGRSGTGGLVRCGCDELDDCDTCRNTGWLGGSECPKCRGRGCHEQVGALSILPTGDVFATDYLNRMRTLGDVEYRTFSTGPYSFRADNVMAFRFGDQGCGFLCPVIVDATTLETT